MPKSTNTILLYYKYVNIDQPEELMLSQKTVCSELGLKGRIIIAKEGINGTVEGLTENTEKYVAHMKADPRFTDIHWKISDGTSDGTAFPKLSIKVRKEIVSAHLDENDSETGDVNPNETTGTHLKPAELREWYHKREAHVAAGGKSTDPEVEFYIVDMRNDYEFNVGHFEGSIRPSMRNFRDLPQFIKEIEHIKHKRVLAVCTGGVRCEKASGYLVKKGFTNVYQLDGGIVSYMEAYPGRDFVGSLYVFDNRICMTFDDSIDRPIIGRCDHCRIPTERYVNCMNLLCHVHFMCCTRCSPQPDAALCLSCVKISTLPIVKDAARA